MSQRPSIFFYKKCRPFFFHLSTPGPRSRQKKFKLASFFRPKKSCCTFFHFLGKFIAGDEKFRKLIPWLNGRMTWNFYILFLHFRGWKTVGFLKVEQQPISLVAKRKKIDSTCTRNSCMIIAIPRHHANSQTRAGKKRKEKRSPSGRLGQKPSDPISRPAGCVFCVACCNLHAREFPFGM